MEINETIIELMANYEAHTGHKPTAIYLGRNEIKMTAFGQRFRTHDRPCLNGVRVYEVCEKNHLGIGLKSAPDNVGAPHEPFHGYGGVVRGWGN